MDETTDNTYDENFELKPGPKDPSVLHLQAEHRSSSIWNVGGGDVQRTRVRNPSSGRFPSLHHRMIPLLRDVGFDGVARLTGIQIDWSLVTALVERWRPETHTFHLPVGECTITLQDVSVILGLRVDGHAITGPTDFKEGWSKLVENMFGEAPGKNNLNGGRLKMSWLVKILPKLSDNADENELIRYTQSYMLQLIGGILFTDHQGSEVHCMFLPLIQSFEHSRTLAWGAGVLAYLYRELCKACKVGVEEIAGCVLLVQLWAWTRLPTLAPVCRGPYSANKEIWGDIPGPFGLRWCVPKSYADVNSHNVSVNRFSLDVVGPDHFIWLPYADVLDELSEICREGNATWCYKGPMICFYIVEPHEPDRCVRQFGMVQDIPSSATVYSRDLHKMTLKGKTEINWRDKHKEHILCWDNRLQFVNIINNVGTGVTTRYAEWYANITRPYHTRVAAAQSYALNILNRISAIAKVNGDYNTIDVLAARARQILESQFSRGLRQDFPIDDSLVNKDLLEVKKRKAGHKGGRGGVNCPKRRKMQIDDERSVNLGKEDENHTANAASNFVLQSNIPVGEISVSIENEVRNHEVNNSGVDPSPASWYPKCNCIDPTPPSSLAPFEQQHTPFEQQQQPPVEHQQPPGPPLIEQQQAPVERVQPPVREQQQPPVEQQKPPGPPLVEQQQAPVEREQPPGPPLVEEQQAPVEREQPPGPTLVEEQQAPVEREEPPVGEQPPPVDEEPQLVQQQQQQREEEPGEPTQELKIHEHIMP